MNISNDKLKKYEAKIDELFSTINDTTQAPAVLLGRFPLVKQNLTTLADTLLQAKASVQDAIIVSEIDFLVNKVSNGLIAFGAKYLGVGDAPVHAAATVTVEPTQTTSQAVAQAVAQVEPRIFTPNTPVVPTTNVAYFILDKDTVVATVYSQEELKTKLMSDYVNLGKEIPYVIQGRMIQPKIKTEIDF